MALPVPVATIRTQVSLPLRLADRYATTARVFSFDGLVDGREHLAFGLGDRAAAVTSTGRGAPPLVRPHSECLTGDVFGSERCDCGPQLREAVQRIAATGGYLLYLRQEGRGIGLYAKLDAYALQTAGSTRMRPTSRWVAGHQRPLPRDERAQGRPHAGRRAVGRLTPTRLGQRGVTSRSACSTVTASSPAPACARRRRA